MTTQPPQCSALSNSQARGLGDRLGQAARNELGVVQRLTGDYPAATASHEQALALLRDLGNRYGQAEAKNNLGELLSQTRDSQQARDHHTQALAVARDLGLPLEEASPRRHQSLLPTGR